MEYHMLAEVAERAKMVYEQTSKMGSKQAMASLNRASLIREYTVDVYRPSTMTMAVALACGTLELSTLVLLGIPAGTRN
jgi:hypothetical protein